MTGMQTLHRANGGYSLQRQGVRGDVGRDTVAPGDGDDAAYAFLYSHDALYGAAFVVALELVRDVDEAACVYDVVGGVEDAALRQGLAVARLGEHVVGAPRDDAASQLWNGSVVENGAEGTGGEDVAGYRQDLIQLDGLGAELSDHTLNGRGFRVGHDQARPFLVQ